MRFGAKGLMSTLMRVRISSDAPRCTVQFGALDPRCTTVQVHGDPNEPSLGAGAAGAPCVTLVAIIVDRLTIDVERCWWVLAVCGIGSGFVAEAHLR